MTQADDSDATADGDSPGWRALRDEYEHRASHLADIEPIRMRSSAVLEAVLDRPPAQALYWLDQMVRGSVWGRQDDLDVALGFVFWLADHQRGGDHYDFFGHVYRIAHEHGVDNVLYLLQNPPPHQELADEADLPEVRLPLERDDVPVGERRTIARRADPDTIDRLVFDPEPLVIQNLLDNPDVTESDVLRIASRRPTIPEILQKVVRHHHWFGRQTVRKALVMNPYSDTGVALKLLPTIGIQALRRVRYGSDLHPTLGEFATHLVDMRETHTSPWEV